MSESKQRKQASPLRITLVGMAGIGKSTWAARLERLGFRRHDCDRMIAERISGELAGAEDLIAALGSWMGMPWDLGYEGRSARYHREEKAVMQGILRTLREPDDGDVVVDTAGSVIYTGDAVRDGLLERSVVVHLAAPPEVRQRLLEAYLKRPGPVLWHGMYRPRPEEPREQALARCYPRLLEDREHRYARWAHGTLAHEGHRSASLDGTGFLERIRSMAGADRRPPVS